MNVGRQKFYWYWRYNSSYAEFNNVCLYLILHSLSYIYVLSVVIG